MIRIKTQDHLAKKQLLAFIFSLKSPVKLLKNENTTHLLDAAVTTQRKPPAEPPPFLSAGSDSGSEMMLNMKGLERPII